jgi:hypothetical protein
VDWPIGRRTAAWQRSDSAVISPSAEAVFQPSIAFRSASGVLIGVS